MHRLVLLATMILVSLAPPAYGEEPRQLNFLLFDAAKGVSKKSYQLETGRYYRWRVVSDGRDEYSFRFPDRGQVGLVGRNYDGRYQPPGRAARRQSHCMTIFGIWRAGSPRLCAIFSQTRSAMAR